MLQFVSDFTAYIGLIFQRLDDTIIYSNEYFAVSFLGVIIAFIFIGILVNVFWRGGQA